MDSPYFIEHKKKQKKITPGEGGGGFFSNSVQLRTTPYNSVPLRTDPTDPNSVPVGNPEWCQSLCFNATLTRKL